MMLNEKTVAAYTAILQEELLPATGCTEPIAVAYCAAKLREALGGKLLVGTRATLSTLFSTRC